MVGKLYFWFFFFFKLQIYQMWLGISCFPGATQSYLMDNMIWNFAFWFGKYHQAKSRFHWIFTMNTTNVVPDIVYAHVYKYSHSSCSYDINTGFKVLKKKNQRFCSYIYLNCLGTNDFWQCLILVTKHVFLTHSTCFWIGVWKRSGLFKVKIQKWETK